MEFLSYKKMYSAIPSVVQTGFSHKSKLFPAAQQEGVTQCGVFLGATAESGKAEKEGGEL